MADLEVAAFAGLIAEEQEKIDQTVEKLTTETSIIEKKKLERELTTKVRLQRSKITSYKKKADAFSNDIQKNVIINNASAMSEKLKESNEKFETIKKKERVARRVDPNANESNIIDAAEMTTIDKVAETGKRVQEETLKSLQRTERMANLAEDMGKETIVELQKQNEVIDGIEKEMEDLGNNLTRAKRDVVWFYRQLAGDKCCVAMFGMIVVGLAFVVFYSFYKKKTG